MFEAIKTCTKCELCRHQSPLIDSTSTCQVIWVGLSAKESTLKNDLPLSPSTNSGRILCHIEERCDNIKTYRTNLVKCVPLNAQGKLRYPNKYEINVCLPHLENEIAELSPRIVFLLGHKVTDAISSQYSIVFNKWDGFDYKFQKYRDVYFIPIHHPSYIYVYKRKYITEYIDSIEKIINKLLSS